MQDEAFEKKMSSDEIIKKTIEEEGAKFPFIYGIDKFLIINNNYENSDKIKYAQGCECKFIFSDHKWRSRVVLLREGDDKKTIIDVRFYSLGPDGDTRYQLSPQDITTFNLIPGEILFLS